MHEIPGKQKVLMFLYEYYFGSGFIIKILRPFGGPLIMLIGIWLYQMGSAKYTIAYSGFCFLYGIYYTLKPFLWILLRWKQYKTHQLIIDIDDEKINITEEKVKGELRFDLFKKIAERPWYFSLFLNNNQKIYLPKNILTEDQKKIIQDKTKQ